MAARREEIATVMRASSSTKSLNDVFGRETLTRQSDHMQHVGITLV